MWIEQKVYSFSLQKGGDVISEDILENIFLKVNENLTTVTLKQLFLKNSEPEIENGDLVVKGWSLLEKVSPITNDLKIKSANGGEVDVKISFESETFGVLEIVEIENPLIQSNDKDVKDEDVELFSEKIIELSKPLVEDIKEEENVNPHTETSSDIVQIVNKKYENGKIRYLNNGYSEFTDGNFKLLLKEKGGEEKIPLFFEVVSEDEVKSIQNVTENGNNEFVFVHDEKQYIGKITDGKLKVETQVEL